MSLPALLEQRLRLPVVAAPMFLISNPQLVLACCRNGVVGSFPALNQRTSEGYEAWLTEIEDATSRYERAGGSLPLAPAASPRIRRARWLLEEFRVSLFAQHLGTAEPVSVQRITKALAG